MTAAADVITSRSISRDPRSRDRRPKLEGLAPWQHEVWEMYDTIGEFAFGVDWIANSLARVNIVAARPSAIAGADPTPIDPNADDTTPAERRAVEIVNQIGGGVEGHGTLFAEIGRHLAIAGLGYNVAEPEGDSDTYESWRVYAVDALRVAKRTGGTVVEIRQDRMAWRQMHPDGLAIKVWHPHPRRHWESHSSARAALPILRIMRMLGDRQFSEGLSRLAGRGIMFVPSEATFPRQGGIDEADAAGEDGRDDASMSDGDFMQLLIDVAQYGIEDPSDPASHVPIMVKIPGHLLEKVQHMDFATEFDRRLPQLMEMSVRRLSIAIDIPPEILLGMGTVNHWGQWKIEETGVELHIKPKAETIVHAWTRFYLREALTAEGLDPRTAVVWYDVSDLVADLDLSAAAEDAWNKTLLSNDAYLRMKGLSPEDKPDDDEAAERRLLEAARGAPTLAPTMLAQAGLIAFTPDVSDAAVVDEVASNELPPPAEADEQPPGMNAAAVVAAVDQIVERGLEHAGNRLRSHLGKGKPGGRASIDAPVPSRLYLTAGVDDNAVGVLRDALDGAWSPIKDVADRHGLDPITLRTAVHAYTTGLVADRKAHDHDRLAEHLQRHGYRTT